jgi:hypothetical protein
MLHDIERAARLNLAQVLDDEVAPGDLDPDVDMANGYGLTSLKKVVFLTALCEDTAVAIGHLTEDDVAGMRTLRQVTAALAKHAPGGRP